MKRILFTAALFFVSVGTVSADYLLIKINLNQLNFFPSPPVGAMGGAGMTGGPAMPAGMAGGPPPGGAAGKFPGGMMGGAPMMAGGAGGPPPGAGAAGMPPPIGMTPGGAAGFNGMPMPNDPSQPKAGDDPNAKWISAFVEIKNRSPKPMQTPYGLLFTYDHKWGKNNWLVMSPQFPMFGGYIPHESFTKEFEAKFNKEKKTKEKSVTNFLHLARWALQRGQIKEFHRVMEDTEKIDAKHPVVKNYLIVKKKLQGPFAEEDPAQRELLAGLKAEYKAFDSERGHYRLFVHKSSEAKSLASIKRRLALMEDTLDSFYYWFAMQEENGRQGESARQPNLPKYRLNAVLTTTKGEFDSRHEQYGSLPMAGDGFTPRRDNVVIMSSKPRLLDPLYNEYESILNSKLAEANMQLQKMGLKVTITPDELLTGDVGRRPGAGNAAVFIGAAQTAQLLLRHLEDEAERHTVTNEAVRQLLIASETFPRNVQIPDWMVEGLAAFFETSSSGLYPTVGVLSWTHLVSFKHLQKTKKLINPPEVLSKVVTDAYFIEARRLAKEAVDRVDNEDAQSSAKQAWEIARCTSWAYIYYLAQDRKLHYLFKYGEELDKLPRDMDLNDLVLQGSFAKAFEMTVTGDVRRIDGNKMKREAGQWFDLMQVANFDLVDIQAYYQDQRAKLDPPTVKTPVVRPNPSPSAYPNPGSGTNPNPNTIINPMPNIIPIMPNPSPMPMPNITPGGNPGGDGQLTGSSWTGGETLRQYGALSFRFNAGGQATMTDRDGNVNGSWAQTGNSVTLKFYGNTVTYTGTMQGNKISGTASNGKDNWTWDVASGNAGANPNAGVNPMPMPFPNPGVNPNPARPIIIRPPFPRPKGF